MSDEKPRRRFVSVGGSKFVLETQAQADYRQAQLAPNDSATVTALREKVAELEVLLAKLPDERDGDSGD